MNDQRPLDTVAFGAAFKKFVDNMNAEAAKEAAPLIERLKAYLGDEPNTVPIVAEEFESYEHPNVQVAMGAVLARKGRQVELIGIAAPNKRWSAITFSDLLSGGGPYQRLTEGPVDYINFRLEDDKVLACVQFGLFLVVEGDDRFAIWMAGPPQQEMGPRVRMRVEIASPRRDAAADLLREITTAMKELNVYRGKAISPAPNQFGVQPLLFELLNQLDGISDDADILYVLTTNRPDILEPALAARPGRVDLAVELPMPDADGRRRLLDLYARGLKLDSVDLGSYVERTAGASPAYVKEMLRRSALLAAIARSPSVTHEHLDTAMTELEGGSELAKRIVGYGTAAYLPPSPSVGPMRPAGFPATTVEVKRPS